MNHKPFIIVRGGGDLATGTIYRLYQCGFQVLVLETDHPSAIRRQVSFCEAIYEGSTVIEGVTGTRIEIPDETEVGFTEKMRQNIEDVWQKGQIPILADPKGISIKILQPEVVVDAILAKKNLGMTRGMAPLTIALGPGFTAGEDVDVVVETMRGHNLGRIIYEGSAFPDTGIPGNIGGYTTERVIRAPKAGTIKGISHIGALVSRDDIVMLVETEQGNVPVKAPISGIIRGMIRDGYRVTEGFKIGDIDPRQEERENCFTISDKARCIAGSVLEVVYRHFAKNVDFCRFSGR